MITNISLWVIEFDKLNCSQKTSYLIEIKGYTENELNWIWELGINCIFENDYNSIQECIKYNK